MQSERGLEFIRWLRYVLYGWLTQKMILLVEVATDRSGTDMWKSTLRLGLRKPKPKWSQQPITKTVKTSKLLEARENVSDQVKLCTWLVEIVAEILWTNHRPRWSKTNIIPDNFPNSFEHYSKKQTSAYYTGE